MTNTSDVDAWIRAHLVVNWMDDNGNVYAIAPQAAVQYDADWKEVNGVLYYTQPVASNATVVLTSSISVSGKAPEGYTLTVEVVSEAIQAEGTTEDGTKAVVDAWGLDPAALS